MSEIRPTGFTNCNFPVGSSWATASGYDLHFTLDGNLRLTGPRKAKLWESGTQGGGGAILSIAMTCFSNCFARLIPRWPSAESTVIKAVLQVLNRG
jgi:hypothetical protein